MILTIGTYMHIVNETEKRKAEKINSILKDGGTHTIQNDAICFLPGSRLPIQTAGVGLQGKIQNILKRYGKAYYFLLDIFKPVYSGRWQKRIKVILSRYAEESIILNLGSGPTYLIGRRDIINIDAYAFNEVDIVADASSIPIEDNSADLIINIALLEHVKTPKEVINEIHRIIKYNGEIFCFVPFMQPFHAAPNDFQRWTKQGVIELFSCFDDLEVSVAQGPTSGFLWVFQEWLSILLSFGSNTLHDILFLIIMILTAPLKLLDLFMIKFHDCEKIASGFYVVAKKLK